MRYITILLLCACSFAGNAAASGDSLSFAFLQGGYAYSDSLGQRPVFHTELQKGQAYFLKGNYDNAIYHLERARRINVNDSSLNVLLFLAYTGVKRVEDASSIAKRLSAFSRKQLRYKPKVIDMAATSFGYIFSNNTYKGHTRSIAGSQNIYGEAVFNGDVKWVGKTLQHSLTSRLRLTYGISFYNAKVLGRVLSADTSGSKYFDNNHIQLNAALSYQFRRGWNLSLAGGIYIQETSWLTSTYDKNTFKYTFVPGHDKSTFKAASLCLSKRMRYLQTSLAATYSNFSREDHYQGELAMTLFPLGNLNLYLSSSVAYLKNKHNDQWISAGAIGSKITSWLWHEEKVTVGNLSNYITSSTFVTYNTSDPIKLIGAVNLRFIFKHFEMIAGYSINRSEGSYLFFDTYTSYKFARFRYPSHSINTTLLWKF